MTEHFDEIVVGAGLAGLACAGELVVQGKRPLLICETAEVGSVFASKKVGEDSFGFLQHITWQLGWGGGWWFQLARDLDIPLRLHQGLGSPSATLRGSGTIVDLPLSPTAASITETFSEAFMIPPDTQGPLRTVLQAALAISHEELFTLDRVPLAKWLVENGADDLTSMMLLTFCGGANLLSLEEATEHLSVLGGISTLRGFICGEVTFPIMNPDGQYGLCVPLAQAIEERGGQVWRRARVERVLIEDGRACGVLLRDGREVRADKVALACGNSRIPAILDPLPEEIRNPLEQASGTLEDFCLYTVLDKPVIPHHRERNILAVISVEDLKMVQWCWPLHAVAPWTTPEGTQLLVAMRACAQDQIAAAGGRDAIYEEMHDLNEELFPGYRDAITSVATQSHKHHWMSPLSIAPKLPRTIDSVPGLWFVGDGSTPCKGLWAEAAASCGILGARQMVGKV